VTESARNIGVLFVCYANVCRSPLAAGLLRELAKQRRLTERLLIDSAGTSALEGARPHRLSCEIAEQHGFSLSGRARQLLRDDLTRFDHVVVMDRQNFGVIERLAAPSGFGVQAGYRAKIRLLRAISNPKAKGYELDVPDPIGGDGRRYAEVYELLRQGCEALLDELEQEQPSVSELAAGTRLGGYTIVREIGAGGMATVYEARQLSLDRPVAIKVLGAEQSADSDMVERFRREAKAAAEIDHENVVRIVDSGVTDAGAPYFVMELLGGSNLAELLRDEGPLPWPRVRRLALQIAAGLEAAHRKGIVHRDIKPANCIVNAVEGGGERLKVCDFGIAKLEPGPSETHKALTKPGTLVGSTRYMAPEQFVSGQATARSDIYALGIVIHELLIGAPPFRSKNPMEVVTMHVRDQPPSVSSLRPELPEVVSDFVLTCLAKRPEQRFADMSELRAALEALPSGDLLAGAGAGKPAGGRPRSMPPTEVLDRPEREAAGQSTATALIDPPTAFMDAPALADEDTAPRRRKRRTATGSFEQPLEAERGSGWWIVAIVAMVVTLAVAAAAMFFAD
jgi:serine/threonine-protein kinase